MIAITFVVYLLTINHCLTQAPRRDEEWPPQDFLQELQPHLIACRTKTGVTEESIKEFSDGSIHENDALKCYMNCLFHEYEVVDDNGDAHIEKIKEKIPDSVREVALRLFDACIDAHVAGGTLCERAFLLHTCWKQADPVHYFLP